MATSIATAQRATRRWQTGCIALLLALSLTGLWYGGLVSAPAETAFADAIWLADANGVRKLSAIDGNTLLTLADDKAGYRLAVDPRGNRVWTIRQTVLAAFDFQGNVLFRVPLPSPSPADKTSSESKSAGQQRTLPIRQRGLFGPKR